MSRHIDKVVGTMDWDEFARRYQPVPGGEFYEVSTSRAVGPEDSLCYGRNDFPRGVPEERVWEMVATPDDPTGSTVLIYPYQCRWAINAVENGCDRIGFMVTEQPHEFANIEVEDRP